GETHSPRLGGDCRVSIDHAAARSLFPPPLGSLDFGILRFRAQSALVARRHLHGRATTFAADTPLAVTGIVYTQGIAGNWLWWSFLPSGMMTVFLFARLCHRSGLLTDVQFAEMRYAGKPAAFLRGFRAG